MTKQGFRLIRKPLGYILTPYDFIGEEVEEWKDADAVGMEPNCDTFFALTEESEDYECPIAEYYVEGAESPIACVSVNNLYPNCNKGVFEGVLEFVINFPNYWRADLIDDYKDIVDPDNFWRFTRCFNLKFDVTSEENIVKQFKKCQKEVEDFIVDKLEEVNKWYIGPCKFEILPYTPINTIKG